MKILKHLVYVIGLIIATPFMIFMIPAFFVATPLIAALEAKSPEDPFNWFAGIELLHKVTDSYFTFIEKYKMT